MKIHSKVFKKAHELRHLFGSFGLALKKAWAVVKLRTAMLKGNVAFKFRKVDGSIREAVGTLKVEYDRKGNGHGTEETFNYYDCISGGWRSFKITNLI